MKQRRRLPRAPRHLRGQGSRRRRSPSSPSARPRSSPAASRSRSTTPSRVSADPLATPPVVLRLDGITKRFGAQLANDDIGFALHEGEVVALLGENGAGKTTLMNILFGHYVADAGTVEVMGRPLPPGPAPRRPRRRRRHGPPAFHPRRQPHRRSRTSPSAPARSGASATATPAPASPTSPAASASTSRPTPASPTSPSARRQRVEILKALYRDARILILDEPTAVLTPQETEALFRTLRLAIAQGLSIVFISHKLREVMAISDRVLVLRHGRLVGERRTADTDRHELARLMVGADIAPPAIPAVPEGPPLLALARRLHRRRPRPPHAIPRPPRRPHHRPRRRLRQRPGRARRPHRRHPRPDRRHPHRLRHPGPVPPPAGRRAPRSPAASPASPRTATAPARSPR